MSPGFAELKANCNSEEDSGLNSFPKEKGKRHPNDPKSRRRCTRVEETISVYKIIINCINWSWTFIIWLYILTCEMVAEFNN